MLGLKNRGSLPSITEDEFDHLVAQFRGLFLVEHNEDGTHITRDRELDYIPVGAIQAWLHATPPIGWVMLDGSQVNRLTYQALFTLWGTTYGVGDGSTTFTLPDMRGRFFLGKAAAGTGSVLGGVGGAIDHTHTGVSHTHTISGSTANESAHTHGAGSLAGPSHTHGAGSYEAASHNHGGTGSTNIDHTHTFSDTDTSDGPSGTSNVAAGSDFGVGSGLHTHSVSISGTTSSDGGSHSHTISSSSPDVSGTSDAGGTGSVTGSTAAGSAHSHGVGTLVASADGAGTTSAANPPFLAGNWIAFAGVA